MAPSTISIRRQMFSGRASYSAALSPLGADPSSPARRSSKPPFAVPCQPNGSHRRVHAERSPWHLVLDEYVEALGGSLSRGEASAQRQDLSGDETGGLRAEEQYRADHVVGVRDPPQRDAADQALVEIT